MPKVKTSINIPAEVLARIENVAEGWYTNRGDAIVRIFLEWEQLRSRQLPLINPTEETEPGDKDSPVAQMRQNNAAHLAGLAA